jgi:hypothetical protein
MHLEIQMVDRPATFVLLAKVVGLKNDIARHSTPAELEIRGERNLTGLEDLSGLHEAYLASKSRYNRGQCRSYLRQFQGQNTRQAQSWCSARHHHRPQVAPRTRPAKTETPQTKLRRSGRS